MFPPRRIPYLPATYYTSLCVQDSEVPSYLPYSHLYVAQFISLWQPYFTLPQLWNLLGPVGSLHSSIICWNMSLLFAQHLLRSLQGVAAFSPTFLHSLLLDCSPSLFSKAVLTLGTSDCHITPPLLQSSYEWFTCLQRFLLLQYCV